MCSYREFQTTLLCLTVSAWQVNNNFYLARTTFHRGFLWTDIRVEGPELLEICAELNKFALDYRLRSLFPNEGDSFAVRGENLFRKPYSSQSCVDWTRPKFVEIIDQLSALPEHVTHFVYVASIRNQRVLVATVVENRGQISDFLPRKN